MNPRPIPFWQKLLLGATTGAIILGAWIVLSFPWYGPESQVVDNLKLPPPLLVLTTTISHAGVLTKAWLATFARVVAGLCLGTSLGVLLAFAMVRLPKLHAALDPWIELLRPIPPFGLIIFLLLWLGLGETGQIVIVSLGVFMVMVVTTMVAVASVERRYINAARSLGADERTIFRLVVIPAATPALISGLRVSAATAVGLCTAAEYLGAQTGLGFLVRNARTTLSTESILPSLLLLGFGSVLLDRLIRFIGTSATRWLDRPLETSL